MGDHQAKYLQCLSWLRICLDHKSLGGGCPCPLVLWGRSEESPGDGFSFGGTAANAYVTSGIAEQVGLAGGEMVDMPSFKFKSVKIKDAPDHKSF